jgi:hypothetical protein
MNLADTRTIRIVLLTSSLSMYRAVFMHKADGIEMYVFCCTFG